MSERDRGERCVRTTDQTEAYIEVTRLRACSKASVIYKNESVDQSLL